eukprot:c20463_g1_i1.p1 GENE.c20463_g1_i1~~c20463_g1_i1.p1  ORF type:complete len:149 (+),score=35.01 c20463_g1_i1:1-447(+)
MGGMGGMGMGGMGDMSHLAPPPPSHMMSSHYMQQTQPGVVSSALSASLALRSPASVGARNPPCNTLFVGNLGSHTEENELKSLFEGFGGFVRLKKTNSRSAFVEFSNPDSAALALAGLDGFQLASAAPNTICIQFAKNPMGTPSSKLR